MRKSDYRIRADVGRIHTDSYAEICRNVKPNSFTRSRKMPYDDLTYSMINRKGLTLSMELRGFMNITHPGEQISKPGYLKQRMKLNPDALCVRIVVGDRKKLYCKIERSQKRAHLTVRVFFD